MSEIYIPPQGLYFRLLGYVSQQVLFSRNAEPQVGQHPFGESYEDQFFTLIHGTGDRRGTYAIKGKNSGKVLYSRTNAAPYVWHTDGNGQYADNWFRLEPGQGQYTKHFRLRCPASNTVIFSRTAAKPYVGNHPAGEVNADHYFTFLFEDMVVDRVDYEFDLGKIVSSAPRMIANQTLTNNTQLEQEMKFEMSEKEGQTTTFDYTTGFSISMGFSFKAGVPGVAESEFRMDSTVSQEWKFGESNSYEKTWTASFPAKASANSVVRAVSSVNRGELEVPYTIHLKSKSAGIRVETKGKWRGISTWDLRHTLSQDRKSG